MPDLLKVVKQKSGRVILFIPNYFDYVRVRRYINQEDSFDIPYVGINEYSSRQEISRARTAFFNKEVSLMVYTERLHFYKRYAGAGETNKKCSRLRIRGANTVIFYAPPYHAHYYREMLDSLAEDVDNETNVLGATGLVCYCRYDYLAMERILGSKRVDRYLGDGSEQVMMIAGE